MTEKEKAKAYDKKIREAILNGLIDCRDAPDLGWSNFGGIHIDDCIDWLEKQGEQASSQTNERAWLNQWISVDDKMPYEYPELLASRDTTVPILTKTEHLGYFVQNMYYIEHRNEWEFSKGGGIKSWMPIPELSKE